MEQEIKTIKLSDCEVDIVAKLNWGQKEAIQTELIKGANINEKGLQSFSAEVMLEAKYKTFEVCVKEIRQGDKKISYTKDWINSLSAEDGDKLYNGINTNISKKKE